jgi:excisionase family DNA binding protein
MKTDNEFLVILTINDVANFLRIPVSSVYKIAQEGKIPAQKVGKRWRFFRPTLLKWMSQQVSISNNVNDEIKG